MQQAGLGAQDTSLQFGFCGDVAVGDYDDFNSGEKPNEAFYAFPSPGYFPTECIAPSVSSWNIAFDTDKLYIADDDIKSVKVRVTNLSKNTSYECTTANDMASVFNSDVAFVQPSDYDKSTGRYTDNYRVVITGLTDKATSKPAQVQYTVKFFELKKYAAGAITKAGLDYSKVVFYKGSYYTTDSLKKLGAILPTTVTLTNDFGNTTQVKTKGKWILDEKNKCWYNSVDPSIVPGKFVDKKGLLSRIEIKYESSGDRYDQYNTLSISPYGTMSCGTDVKFSIYRFYYWNEISMLGLIAKDKNGDYYCKKSYNSLTSPEIDTKPDRSYHYYNIKATGDDSGEYISIYYSSENSRYTAYACNTIQTLNVEHNYSTSVTKQATDNARGTQTRKCQICGQTETKEFVGSKRLAGDNRFKTAVEISKAEFTTAKTVVLAYGMNYADALAGGVLAAKKAAPLLLTANILIDEQTAYLKSKKPNNIYTFGGTGVVSADIVDKITKAAV